MSDRYDPEERRTTMLSYLLGGMVFFFSLAFLILITGGFFVQVALIVGVIALFGWFHYVVWGKLLTAHTAGEREEAELLDRVKEDAERELKRTFQR